MYNEPYTMALPYETPFTSVLIPIIISRTVIRTYMILIAVELSAAFWAKKSLFSPTPFLDLFVFLATCKGAPNHYISYLCNSINIKA